MWSREAQKLLDNGYSISSSFEVVDKEKANDLYHNIKYDNKANEIKFIDLAIVKEPRYQEAKLYVNSKEKIYNNGGDGSGNWGRKGRAGKIGGSAPYSSMSAEELITVRNNKLKRQIESKDKSKLVSTIKSKVKEKVSNSCF